MAERIFTTKLALVNKTTEQWALETSVPVKGCPCVEWTVSGKPKLKIGDGSNTFADLEYVGGSDEAITEVTYDQIVDALGYIPINPNIIGVANGVVPLDENSLISSVYLPSYVDDVIEVNGIANAPEIGEAGKIYVDTATDTSYRWTGTMYSEISKSITVTASENNGYVKVNGTDVLVYTLEVDDALSAESEKPVMNKVVTAALNDKVSVGDTLILNCTL